MTGLSALKVYCQEWEARETWFQQGSSAVAIFEMDNGAVFNYRGSWCAAGLSTSWECSWRFVGTRGTLLWDGHEQVRAEVTSPHRQGLFDEVVPVLLSTGIPSGRTGGHLGVLQDFIAAVRGGPAPETSGDDNIHSLSMTLGAIDSARLGRRIDITN